MRTGRKFNRPEPGTYSAKLQDPRWQKLRLEILERDEWRCALCAGAETTLHVHHRWYVSDRDPWDYPSKALVTLCVDCHEYETQALPGAINDAVLRLKQLGAMSADFEALSAALMSVDPAAPSLDSLDNAGFSVFAHHIAVLLSDRAKWGDRWFAARDEYFAHLAELHADRGQDRSDA